MAHLKSHIYLLKNVSDPAKLLGYILPSFEGLGYADR